MSDAKERIAGRLVVASVSGGKDSAAMSLYLHELGIEHRRVFMDTGWEHARTYDYLRGELARALGPIEEIRAARTMEELIRSKGMFPTRQRRFCTTELKIAPMKAYLEWLREQSIDPVNVIGIRAEESVARSRLSEWEWSKDLDCEVWRPLLRWSFADVVAIHQRHGLRPNPLYFEGFSRVGCWPCIMSNKGEIRMLADRDPARISRLRVLEDEMTQAARGRGHEGEAAQRSWFQAATGRAGTWPIDRVVEWARTPRGMPGAIGQGELFAPSVGDDGCMRWGMCDTPTTEAA